MVRAKFRCVEKTEYEGEQHHIKLEPVTDGSKENEDFFRWTPAGDITLEVVNDKAAAEFKPGKEYYVDFSEAN